MRKHLVLAAVAAGLLSLYGCQPVHSPLGGIIFNETKFGYIATTNAAMTKEGKACGTTILGWVATGDMSISAAKRPGCDQCGAHRLYRKEHSRHLRRVLHYCEGKLIPARPSRAKGRVDRVPLPGAWAPRLHCPARGM